MAYPITKWRWLGEAAHFCCGRWCRFHLATVIGPYLVSTVGNYVHPRHSGGSEATEARWIAAHPDGDEIGVDRLYETMVFKVTEGECECGCGQPNFDAANVDFYSYNTRKDAAAGHMAMCHKWAKEVK